MDNYLFRKLTAVIALVLSTMFIAGCEGEEELRTTTVNTQSGGNSSSNDRTTNISGEPHVLLLSVAHVYEGHTYYYVTTDGSGIIRLNWVIDGQSYIFLPDDALVRRIRIDEIALGRGYRFTSNDAYARNFNKETVTYSEIYGNYGDNNSNSGNSTSNSNNSSNSQDRSSENANGCVRVENTQTNISDTVHNDCGRPITFKFWLEGKSQPSGLVYVNGTSSNFSNITGRFSWLACYQPYVAYPVNSRNEIIFSASWAEQQANRWTCLR